MTESKEEHEKKEPPKEHTKEHEKKEPPKEHKKPHHKKKKIKLFPIIAIIAILIFVVIIVLINTRLIEKPKDIAAIVNGEEISLETLDKEYELFFVVNQIPQMYKQMIPKVEFLESNLVVQKMVFQEARKQDMLTVSKREVDGIYNAFLSGTSIEELNQTLNSVNLTLEDVRDSIKRDLVLFNFLNSTILKTISVSEEEVESYYNENKDLFEAQEGQIRASHILVETEAEAEEILEQLDEGTDFATLAKEKSIDPSAQSNSGDLGFFGKDQMIEEFEDAAFALEIGEISEPVETTFGFHIIKRMPDSITLEEANEEIKQSLLLEKQQTIIKAYLEELKEKSDIKIYLEDTTAIDTTGAAVSELEENIGDEEITAASSDCITNYDVTSDTVIFYHADWCGYCNQMMPIVEELEDEGYKFLWSETSKEENIEIIEACFKDVIQGGVPEFICAGTSEVIVGARPKEDLKEFADKCQ